MLKQENDKLKQDDQALRKDMQRLQKDQMVLKEAQKTLSQLVLDIGQRRESVEKTPYALNGWICLAYLVFLCPSVLSTDLNRMPAVFRILDQVCGTLAPLFC